MSDLPNEDKPSATFHCKSLLWQQIYSLYGDRITVDTTHRFSGESRATYLLTSLTSFPTRGSSRGDGLNWGILLIFLGFGFTAFYYYVGGLERERLSNLMIVMGLSGVIWFLYSLRQWHYAIFSTAAGVEVLSLWSPPKTVDSFIPFVDACEVAIESAAEND